MHRFAAAATVAVALLAGTARADDARSQFARASEAVKAGRFDEAVDAYTRAETLAASSVSRANAANGAGFVFLRLRRHAEAIPYFTRAVAADPRHKVAWHNLGVCHLRRFEAGLSGTEALDSALAAFRAATTVDPAFHPDHLKAAQALLDREAACLALTTTLAGISSPPPAPAGSFVSYRTAGDLAEAACDWETARANYDRAEAVATSKRNRCAAANLLGLLALRTRAPQAAVDAFRRATVTDPANKYGWNNLGVALMRLYDGGTGGKELVEQALEAFERVAAIDAAYKPDNLAWSHTVLTELGGPTLSATLGQESGPVQESGTSRRP